MTSQYPRKYPKEVVLERELPWFVVLVLDPCEDGLVPVKSELNLGWFEMVWHA